MANYNDPYNSVPKVAPTVKGVDGSINVRANPKQFGAQIGQSLQNLGETVGESNKIVLDYVLKEQGMINEALSTQSSVDFDIFLGEKKVEYESLKGFAAAGARKKIEAEIIAKREEIKGKLPNAAAQRAFETLSLRPMGFAIREAGDYAAGQIKAASEAASTASLNLNKQKMANAWVANDPERAQEAVDNIKFDVMTILQNRGFLKSAPNGEFLSDENGDPLFADDERGRQASAVYRDFMDREIGEAKELQYKTLSQEVNPLVAFNKLQKDKDVPPDTRAKIKAFLLPAVNNENARLDAGEGLTIAERDYRAAIGQAGSVRQSIRTQEWNGPRGKAPTSHKGAGSDFQITEGTWKQYAKPGERMDKYEDAEAVYNRIMDDYESRPGWGPDRVAVAYFSGPGNVSPVGSEKPYLNDTHDGTKEKPGKYVSEYVNEVLARMGKGQVDPDKPGYITQADFLSKNYEKYRQIVEDYAASRPGATVTTIDAARQRYEQYVNDVIQAQTAKNRAGYNALLNYVTGKTVGGSPMTNIDQIREAPKDIQNLFYQMQIENPYGVNGLMNIISQNNRGQSSTYGTNMVTYWQGILAPPGSKEHIADPAVLANAIGKGRDNAITKLGYEALTEEQQYLEKHPMSREAQNKFMKQIYSEFFPKLYASPDGLPDAELLKKLNNQIPIILNLIKSNRDQWAKEGLSEAAINNRLYSLKLDGKPNPDYVGNHIQRPTQDELRSAQFNNLLRTTTTSTAQTKPTKEIVFKKPEDLQRWIDEGKITDPKEIAKILREKGWAVSAVKPQ